MKVKLTSIPLIDAVNENNYNVYVDDDKKDIFSVWTKFPKELEFIIKLNK